MEVVNPFILKNKIGLVKFIDELCNVDFTDPSLIDKSVVELNNNESDEFIYPDDEDQEPAYYLAMIHKICEAHRVELERAANSSQAARKLSTIMSILSKHKQYYSNLRRNAQHYVNTTSI